MKEKIFNIIIIILSIFVLIELLIKKEIIYSAIIYALNMWVKSLLPALFPFFIISDILINYNIIDYIPKIIKNICKKIFNITDNMLTILFLSMISGFPSNARNTRNLYDNNAISIEEANHILIFSHFANPVFILTTVAIFFFNNIRVGIILLVVHYASNIILGILFRNKFIVNKRKENIINNKQDFGVIFILAIKKAIDTILMICGILVVFLMLAAIIINTFRLGIYGNLLIKSIFEITIGIDYLSSISSISLIQKVIISRQILAFGGISVHVQVISQIAGTKIKYSYFFMGRMYQVVISTILSYILCLVIGI